MKAVSKLITGAAVAAMISVGAAAPAEAQYRDRYRDRDRSIDGGDIITGIAILGGIAAVTSALSRDGSRYGYGNNNRYRGGYSQAVQSCGYEAQRIGRGQVRITDVDRTGNDRFRVRGVIESNYGYDRGGYGYDRGGYNRNDRYGRYDRYERRGDREDFTCHARGNGRITDFNL
ncbi:MAG TPA: hypothetical protein VGB65_00085 [Allosphingosinicella sp.]|jgi:hypothetical protein